MDGSVEMTTVQSGHVEAPIGATAPAAPAQEAAAPVAPQAPAQPNSKVISVPTHAMARIKQEEFDKGKEEALASFAKTSGFESPQAMAEFLQGLRAQKTTPPVAAQPKVEPKPVVEEEAPLDPAALRAEKREAAVYARNLEKAMNERNRYAQEAQKWKQEATQRQEALDMKEAEMSLRETAMTCGAKDVDYCLRLLSRELEKMEPDAIAQFDERQFFSSLRQERPYLFGETVQPATTGNANAAAPGSPKPAAAAAAATAATKKNARDMTPQEYKAHLARMGLNQAF
jgi:hypothetical protein